MYKLAFSIVKGENLPDPLRFGAYFFVDGDSQVEYYGRGPEENYWDRKDGSPVGLYKTTVDDMSVFCYSKPCEFGARCDCRWIEVTGKDGTKLRVTALDANGVKTDANGTATITASVRRALNRDLESVEHVWPRHEILPQCGSSGQGVGSDRPGAPTLPEVPPKRQEYPTRSHQATGPRESEGPKSTDRVLEMKNADRTLSGLGFNVDAVSQRR